VDVRYKKTLYRDLCRGDIKDMIELVDYLRSTTKQLIIFSGKLSFINLKNKGFDMFVEIESLVKKGVSIKIISRVDIAGIEKIEKMLSLNQQIRQELVEIRHREQASESLHLRRENSSEIKEIKRATGR
jgi:hypothetical protein